MWVCESVANAHRGYLGMCGGMWGCGCGAGPYDGPDVHRDDAVLFDIWIEARHHPLLLPRGRRPRAGERVPAPGRRDQEAVSQPARHPLRLRGLAAPGKTS
eukprot:9495265-Pyramimonas_sp.AAC.1